MSDNPFGALGLPARAGLTDDDVRAAWRRLAAATHPDRADGGDPARFAAAAAAYTVLRTRSSRGEALADLTAPLPPPGHAAPPAAAARPRSAHPAGSAAPPQPSVAGSPAAGLGGAARTRLRMPTRTLATRLRHGRPARLLLRVLIAAALSAGVAVVAGLRPATPALIVGVATWLLLTGRHDLAPPR